MSLKDRRLQAKRPGESTALVLDLFLFDSNGCKLESQITIQLKHLMRPHSCGDTPLEDTGKLPPGPPELSMLASGSTVSAPLGGPCNIFCVCSTVTMLPSPKTICGTHKYDKSSRSFIYKQKKKKNGRSVVGDLYSSSSHRRIVHEILSDIVLKKYSYLLAPRIGHKCSRSASLPIRSRLKHPK